MFGNPSLCRQAKLRKGLQKSLWLVNAADVKNTERPKNCSEYPITE